MTLGEGRNWGSSSNGGLAYTGRLELYPLGRFKSKGDVMEGDFEGEEQVKITRGRSLLPTTTRHRA